MARHSLHRGDAFSKSGNADALRGVAAAIDVPCSSQMLACGAAAYVLLYPLIVRKTRRVSTRLASTPSETLTMLDLEAMVSSVQMVILEDYTGARLAAVDTASCAHQNAKVGLPLIEWALGAAIRFAQTHSSVSDEPPEPTGQDHI